MTRLHFPNIFVDADLWRGMISDLSQTKFPPTDVVRIDEDEYTINMALAGYNRDDIYVHQGKGVLTVEGEAPKNKDTNYVMHGIAKGHFRRDFPLEEHIRVVGVKLEDGMLIIGLSREVPEKDKPQEFEIN